MDGRLHAALGSVNYIFRRIGEPQVLFSRRLSQMRSVNPVTCVLLLHPPCSDGKWAKSALAIDWDRGSMNGSGVF